MWEVSNLLDIEARSEVVCESVFIRNRVDTLRIMGVGNKATVGLTGAMPKVGPEYDT